MTDGVRLSITIDKGAFHLDKRQTRALMRQVGNEIAAVTRSMIRSSVGGGRVYRLSAGKSYTASAPGQPPANRTGGLAGSVVVRPFKSGDGVAVRETAFYALFLATGAQGGIGSGRKGMRGRRNPRQRGVRVGISGTRVLLPRPSLTLALEQREESISARVRASIMDGIKFKRQRA